MWQRLLPYAVLGVLTLIVIIGSVYTWEYTNSSEFCGTACHTMPPEYTSYLTSPHARIDCVECHIGRGFVATRISRKAGDVGHIVSLALQNYEFPIRADDLRPARETCEKCHFPEKFSDDSLREIKRYENDLNNTALSTYLTLKTGGGSKRQGLGRGIHWHIENPTFFYTTDPGEQSIPYIRYETDDGTIIEYLDVEVDIDPEEIDPSELEEMDCITCHNRITHLVPVPEDTVDNLISRGLISPSIPEIRRKAIEVYSNIYSTTELGLQGIAGLEGYYQTYYPEFYGENQDLITSAIEALQDAYAASVFPEQNSDWTSHPNNIGHKNTPGCFRCHDGKHLNKQGEAIRLECNICHSIPVVAGPLDFVSNIEISRGPEPASHINPNWIVLHRDTFDETCSNCHTVENPGGVDNSSFCANSACHGLSYEFAGFDAPGLREALALPEPEPSPPLVGGDALTFSGAIGSIFANRCGSCHGPGGMAGLDLTDYSAVLEGSRNGPVIIVGNPEDSTIVAILTGDQPHFAQLSTEELNLLQSWIAAGAPES